MLLKRVPKNLSLLSLVIALTACGGGGSSDKKPSSSSTSSVQSSIAQSSNSTSSVNSSISSSIQSSISQSSQPDETGIGVTISGSFSIRDKNGVVENDPDIDDVEIKLSLLGQDQQVVKTNNPAVINSGSATRFGFSDQLSAANARFVVVHISKPGYTDFARRFDITEAIELSADLSKLPEAHVEVAEAETISGEIVNGFNFSVTGNMLGESDSGYGKELSVFIPQSALPAGTESLVVQMKAYDPTNPAEASYFPGAYEDSDGNKLLSIAFNYTDIKTEEGVSLQKVAQKTRQERLAAQKSGRLQKTESTEPVIINRMIPTDSCRSLATMGDSDSSLPGFQIPVYTYNPNSGLWDLLGQGSVFNEDSELLASDFTNFDCDSVDYMLEIKVTNEIFISNWWNLDYPLAFDEPVNVCAKLTLLDEGNSPLAGTYVYAFDDDDERSFSAQGFISNSEGNVTISLARLNANDTDSSINIWLYSPLDGVEMEKTVEVSTTSCESSAVATPVEFSIPSRCVMTGKLLNNNSMPFANGMVLAWPQTDEEGIGYSLGYAYSDSEGNYNMNLFCGQDYRVTDYITWFSSFAFTSDVSNLPLVNVNNQITSDEISDDGKKVVFSDLVSAAKPWGLVFESESSNQKLDVIVYYSGSDFPVTYSFDLIDSETKNVIKHIEGTLVENDFMPTGSMSIASVEVAHGLSVPPAGTYKIYSIEGQAKDSKNVVGRLWGSFIHMDETELE